MKIAINLSDSRGRDSQVLMESQNVRSELERVDARKQAVQRFRGIKNTLDTDYATLTKGVLSYEEGSGYDVRMPEAFVALIAPIFVRIRDDKQVDPTDLRLTQLRPYVDLDNLDSGASRQEMAQSEVSSRSVFTKVAKELTSVRKFVCWETNKDEIDPSFPAYVFCYVDFSPSRAKPLARSLRASNARQQIEQIYANSIAKNVKKGWNPADA